MLRPSLAVALATLSCLAVTACGNGGSTTGAGGSGTGGAGGGVHRPPMVHRAEGVACTGMRATGSMGTMQPGDTCELDADCTMGTNGRCVGPLGGMTSCSYDECADDAGCGAAVTVCECRDSSNYYANTCVQGTCRVDADCGAAGYCSPSAVTLGPDCNTGISAGSVGYFCHQPADECVDDADCSPGMTEGACIFSVDAMHWICHQLMCTG